MIQTPKAAQELVAKLSPAFTKPTALRMVNFALATIITIGRRTVTATLIVAFGLLIGHFTIYYRLFSRPAWSPWVSPGAAPCGFSTCSASSAG